MTTTTLYELVGGPHGGLVIHAVPGRRGLVLVAPPTIMELAHAARCGLRRATWDEAQGRYLPDREPDPPGARAAAPPQAA